MIAHFTKLVLDAEIVVNDYNLSVSSYVEQEDIREVVNIKKLNAEIKQIVVWETECAKR
jgi:type I restriction enzyme M protein